MTMTSLATEDLAPALPASTLPSCRCDAGHHLNPVGYAVRRLLREVPGPVVIYGPSCATAHLPTGGDVIVCLDASTRSEAVLPIARAAARSMGGRLCLVAVLTPSATTTAHAAGCDAERLLAGRLAKVARDVATDDVRVEWEVLHGSSVAAALTEYVASIGSAVLALNSHLDGTPPTARVSDVALAIVRDAAVPVLLSRSVAVAPIVKPSLPSSHAPRRPPRAMVRSTGTSERPASVATRVTWPAVLLVLVGLLTLSSAPVPFNSVHGELRALAGHISITGAPLYPPEGEILLPVVTVQGLNLRDAVRGWLQPGTAVRRRSDGDGSASGRWAAEMETGKRSAQVAALNTLAHVPGATGSAGASISIDSARIVGPSAGLAYALGVVDALTPGELTGGGRVVVTGEIHADGAVTQVGGIAFKTAAARSANPDLFIVPCRNLREAVANAHLMRVECADSLEQAIRVLSSIGGGLRS